VNERVPFATKFQEPRQAVVYVLDHPRMKAPKREDRSDGVNQCARADVHEKCGAMVALDFEHFPRQSLQSVLGVVPVHHELA